LAKDIITVVDILFRRTHTRNNIGNLAKPARLFTFLKAAHNGREKRTDSRICLFRRKAELACEAADINLRIPASALTTKRALQKLTQNIHCFTPHTNFNTGGTNGIA